MKKLKIAIAGLGRIGKIHLKNLAGHSQVELAGVMDIDANSKIYAEELGIGFFTGNFDDLIGIPGLDAVAICSPTDTHAEFVTRAAMAGKQVFCEKPLDLSLKRVKEVLRTLEETKVKCMLGFNRRFDPEFRKIRELVSEGAVGDPQVIKITSRDPGPPPVSYIRSSGGIFLDMTIHDFDMARYISGKQVKEVFSRGATLVDAEIGKAGDLDTAITTLIFEDNTMAVIDNCRKAVYGYDQRLEVFGSKGMLMADNKFKDYYRLYGDSAVTGSLPMNFFMDRYAESYMIEINSFVKSVVDGTEMPVDGNDGLQSLVIGLAAKKSTFENRLVKISEIHL
ncbi:MAG TPA: inositol 2-dehydrogenase [Cyclobacteriaceae bacterium]|nr:inositol 2-dehydrogenase [Cyclobacteriaceae bacterium]